MSSYVSIDIETTGIAPASHILQISAVLDDLKSPISELKTLDLPIKYESISYSEPYALGMNAELFKKMMNPEFKTYSPRQALEELLAFVISVQESLGLDKRGNKQRVLVAGKNVSSFDITKIHGMFLQYFPEAAYMFDPMNNNAVVSYKSLDVGSLYFDVFKENASLSKINKLTGRNAVSHNALDDAFDVVYAVRHKLGVSNE
jgi:hypothetical protein